MTMNDNARSNAQYPELPTDVDGAAVAIQRRIDSWRDSLFPGGAAAALADLIDASAAPPPPGLVEQREKLAVLGLDPDVLAPLPPARQAHVGTYAALMAFPESEARDWLEGRGFADGDIEAVVARLVFVPPEVAEFIGGLDAGVTDVGDGREVDVVVEPADKSPLGRGRQALRGRHE